MTTWLRPTEDEPRTRLKLVTLFTPARLAVLDAITRRPGVCMSDVARELGTHPSSVGAAVFLLQQAGLVRGERDGRCVRLFATGTLTSRERTLAKLGASAPVYDAICANVPGTAPAISAYLGISRHEARSHLARLARLGMARKLESRVLTVQWRYFAPDQEAA